LVAKSSNASIANSSVPLYKSPFPGKADRSSIFAVGDVSGAVARQSRSAFSDAIASVADELLVETAVTPGHIIEVHRFRDRVYCDERGLELRNDGLARDCFDAHSRHVLVRRRVTGAILGTVRVVLPITDGSSSFPMSNVCEDDVFSSIPQTRTGEISRFALARDRTGVSPAAAALTRLCLVRGLVDISGQVGLTHWCALMESSLLRLLRATAIYFEAIGPAVDFQRRMQPVVWDISTGLAGLRRERPDVWGYITGNGTLGPRP
jgi:N-acyl-L-homoserine lactone synthetase